MRAASQRRAGLMFLRALWCAPGNYLSHLSSARCRMRSIIRSPRSVHHDNSQTQHLKLTKPAARCSSTIGESTGRRAFCEPIVLASDLFDPQSWGFGVVSNEPGGGQGPAIPSPTGGTRGAGRTPGPGSDGTREAWRDREMAFLAVPWRLSQRRLARGAGGERMPQRTSQAREMLPWVGWFGGPDGFGARYAVVRCM